MFHLADQANQINAQKMRIFAIIIEFVALNLTGWAVWSFADLIHLAEEVAPLLKDASFICSIGFTGLSGYVMIKKLNNLKNKK